jgi:hypothetical protein
MELDGIIDAMLQDGTIRIKPVSPFMAWLRTIGSAVFVKLVIAKRLIGSWVSRLCCHHEAVEETNSNYHEQHNG